MDGNLCVRLVLSLREQVGQAAFLLLCLMARAPADWNGDVPVYVDGGRLISDAWLAQQLSVKPRRLSAWRKKLKAALLLDWTLKPGVGRVYVLGSMADPRSADAPLTEEPEQLASRLVQ
jgi:hypothetical protein